MKYSEKAQDIIKAYLKCTAQNGSCSASDIADVLSLSKSGLYNYFSGMANIRISSFIFCDDIVRSSFPDVDFKQKNLAEMLGKLVFDMCEVLSRDPICFYFTVIVSSCRYDESSNERLTSIRNMLLARTRVALEYAVQEGWISLKDTDGASFLFVSSVMNIISCCGNGIPFDELKDNIENFVLIISMNVRS